MHSSYSEGLFDVIWCELSMTNPISSQTMLHEQIGTFFSNSIRKRIDLLTDKIWLIRNGFYENNGFHGHHYLTGKTLSSFCQGSNMITVNELRERISFRNVSVWWARNNALYCWSLYQVWQNCQKVTRISESLLQIDLK